MPKETIHDSTGTYDVRVGWQDGVVQVGVEQAAGFSLVTMLYGDEDARIKFANAAVRLVHDYDAAAQGSPAELGRALLDALEVSNPAIGSVGYTGVWSTLDRPSVNRLIRVCRNARDRAYGKDE